MSLLSWRGVACRVVYVYLPLTRVAQILSKKGITKHGALKYLK